MYDPRSWGATLESTPAMLDLVPRQQHLPHEPSDPWPQPARQSPPSTFAAPPVNRVRHMVGKLTQLLVMIDGCGLHASAVIALFFHGPPPHFDAFTA